MTRHPVLWPDYYDVVILPSAPLRDQAILLSRRLHSLGGQWRLGKQQFLPHISLYHVPVLRADLENFLAELQRVVDTAPLGPLETAGFDMPVIMMNKPDWLKNLHRRVVQRTVRYFNRRYGVEKLWGLKRFSGRRLEFAGKYLRQYGTPMVGMNFRPHITLNSFEGPEPAGIEFEIRPMKFLVDRLHVCELGQSHSCHRIVRELLARPD